jgi:hypothetical protein
MNNSEKVRSNIWTAVDVAEANPNDIHVPTKGQRGAVIGIINKIVGGDENRHLLMGWMFAPDMEHFNIISTKTLNDAQWAALYGWIDFRKDEDHNVWLPQPEFVNECLACMSEAMRAYQRVKYGDQHLLPEPPELVAIATQLGGEIESVDNNRKAGVRVPDDSVFAHQNALAKPPEKKPVVEPEGRNVLREPFKDNPPQLKNPF